jgi:hypothetical protein
MPKTPSNTHLASLPRRVGNAQRVAVRVTGLVWEETPRDQCFDRGVTDTAGSPVDDGGELAVSCKQVEVRQVAVEPDGWAIVVGGRQDAVPRLGDGVVIDLAT